MNLWSWLRFVRFANALTTVADVCAGWVAARALSDVSTRNGSTELSFTALACILIYATGIVTNDIGDRAKDSVLYPERPLPSGVVSLTTAVALSSTLTVAAFLLLLFVQSSALPVAAVLMLLIMLYNFILPDGSWASGISMGGCRVLALTLGAAVTGVGAENLFTPSIVIPFVSYGALILLVTRVSLREGDDQATDIPLTFKVLIPACSLGAIAPTFPPLALLIALAWTSTFWLLPPPGPAAWVRRVVFTTPIHGALIACSVGSYVAASLIASITLVVAAVRALIAQRDS